MKNKFWRSSYSNPDSLGPNIDILIKQYVDYPEKYIDIRTLAIISCTWRLMI